MLTERAVNLRSPCGNRLKPPADSASTRRAVERAKLGNDEKLGAIRRLDEQVRRLERTAGGPSLPQHIATERRRSHEYGGRSVFGWESAPAAEQVGG